MSRRELFGVEFDWFAVDAMGYIGHFATAGFGPVPRAVVVRLDELRDLDERLLRLPVLGDAISHQPGRIESWLEMARRGLFAYDWKHWKGPYLRTATPTVPVRVTDLPNGLRDAVSVVEWPGARFSELDMVRPEELCLCD